MKIVCINRDTLEDGAPFTVGKSYDIETPAILFFGNFYIILKNDIGKQDFVRRKGFVTEQEYRKMKLLKIKESNI